MSLPIKKVYVNSRYKTADSVSDSNFKFELPYVLTMPSNAFFTSQTCVYQIYLKLLPKMKMINYMLKQFYQLVEYLLHQVFGLNIQ